MRYTLFPWDCSSIGQSTALSRRKLRVRAPSVPTDPINTSTHLFILWQNKHNEMNRISVLLNIYFLFFRYFSSNTNIKIFITSTSPYWWERGIIGLVQLLGTSYSGFQGITYWVWSFNLLPLYNGIEYHMFLGSTYTIRIHYQNSFLVHSKIRFELPRKRRFRLKLSPFLVLI